MQEQVTKICDIDRNLDTSEIDALAGTEGAVKALLLEATRTGKVSVISHLKKNHSEAVNEVLKDDEVRKVIGENALTLKKRFYAFEAIYIGVALNLPDEHFWKWLSPGDAQNAISTDRDVNLVLEVMQFCFEKAKTVEWLRVDDWNKVFIRLAQHNNMEAVKWVFDNCKDQLNLSSLMNIKYISDEMKSFIQQQIAPQPQQQPHPKQEQNRLMQFICIATPIVGCAAVVGTALNADLITTATIAIIVFLVSLVQATTYCYKGRVSAELN